MGWGEALIAHVDLIVFVVTPTHDDPNFSGRNRVWHEALVSRQKAPVSHVDGVESAERIVAGVVQEVRMRHGAIL